MSYPNIPEILIGSPGRSEILSVDTYLGSGAQNNTEKDSRFKIKSSQEDYSKVDLSQSYLKTFTPVFNKSKSNTALKFAIYNFLVYPDGMLSSLYHLCTFALFVAVLALTCVYTVIEVVQNKIVFVSYLFLSTMCLITMLAHVGLTLWSCSCRWMYRGKNQYKIIFEYTVIIDFIIVHYFFLVILLHIFHGDHLIIYTIISWLRFFQVGTLLHFERYNRTISSISKIIWRFRNELMASYLIMVYLIMSFTFIIYLSEVEEMTSNIKKLPDSLYFTLITYTTIGYGDFHPKSIPGKIFVSALSLISVSFVALPSGLISSAIALELSEERKKQKRQEIKPYAARVIQAAWRDYSLRYHELQSKTFKSMNIYFTASEALVRVSNGENNQDSFLTTPAKLAKTKIVKIEDINLTEKAATVLLKNRTQGYYSQKINFPISLRMSRINLIVFTFVSSLKLFASVNVFKRRGNEALFSEDVLEGIQRQNAKMFEDISVLDTKLDLLLSEKKVCETSSVCTIVRRNSVPTKKSNYNKLSVSFNNLNQKLLRLQNLLDDLIIKTNEAIL